MALGRCCACSIGLIVWRWKSEQRLIVRAHFIVWSLVASFGSAFVLRWTLRWDRIEKADRRQMTLFIESAYPIERTNKWGMTRTVGYRIRTAEYGVTNITSSVYRKLLPNRKLIVIASTIFGLRVERVMRTVRHDDD